METLSNYKLFWLIALSFVYLTGCSKNGKQDKNLVKVNETVLSQKMLDSALTSQANSAKGRAEFINDWIETELLYQEAVKEGITKQDNFISLLERSKKKLAGTLLIEKLTNEENLEPNEDEIKKYYEDRKEDFRLGDDLFILNIASFSDYKKAVQFRNKLIETNWLAVESIFKSDSTVSLTKNKFSHSYELQPVIFHRVINTLLPGEISVVLEREPGLYSVLQVVEKLNRESIPSFEYVKEEAKQKLLVIKKREFIHNYINKLISDQNLEIERYSE